MPVCYSDRAWSITMHGKLLLATLILTSLALASSTAEPESNGYYVFPIEYKQSSYKAVRRRNMLNTGKVLVDGSVRVGYFYAVLMLGTPPKPFDVIVDTGSTVTYVPCNNCQHCGHHNDDPYNPSKSATSNWVHCSDAQCGMLRSTYYCSDSNANQCSYKVSYLERSSSQGRLVQDVFSFPDNATKVPVTFGCENSETGEIYRQKPDGILGMGNSAAAFHSQLAAAGAIPDVFSLCFGFPSGGALLLGQAPVPGNPTFQWTPLIRSGWGDFFTVNMESVIFNGKQLDVPATAFSSGYGTVLDSGTTFIYLATPAYQLFAASVFAAASAAGLKHFTNKYRDNCWSGLKPDYADIEKMFPPASLGFGGGTLLQLPAYRYLYQFAPSGTYCLAVFDNGNSGSLLGGVATRNVLVRYDVDNQRIGFAEMDCNKLGKLPTEQFNTVKQPAAGVIAADIPQLQQQQQKQLIKVQQQQADQKQQVQQQKQAAKQQEQVANQQAQQRQQQEDEQEVMQPKPDEHSSLAAKVKATQAEAAKDQTESEQTDPVQDAPLKDTLVEVGGEAYEEALDILDQAAVKAQAVFTSAAVAAAKQQKTVAAAPAAAGAGPTSDKAAAADVQDSNAAAGDVSAAAAAAAASTASSGSGQPAEAKHAATAPGASALAATDATAAPNATTAVVTSASAVSSNPPRVTSVEAEGQQQQQPPVSNMTTTTAVVSPAGVLVPLGSGNSSGGGSSSSSDKEPAAAAQLPSKVYWGSGDGQAAGTHAETGLAGYLENTSPAVVLALLSVSMALLLTIAGAIAYTVRRRRIQAGFTQLSTTENDCELTGFSSNDRLNGAGCVSTPMFSSGSGSREALYSDCSQSKTVPDSNSLRHDMTAQAAQHIGSLAAYAAGTQARSDGSVANELDSDIRKGRDQHTVKQGSRIGSQYSSEVGVVTEKHSSPSAAAAAAGQQDQEGSQSPAWPVQDWQQQEAAAAVTQLVPPPAPQWQQQQQQRRQRQDPPVAGASLQGAAGGTTNVHAAGGEVLAVYSLEHDEAEGQKRQQQIMKARAGDTAAATSSAGAASSQRNPAGTLSLDSMEFIPL